MPASHRSHTDPRWLAYLKLLRLPNVFTALADVSMGSLLATGGQVDVIVFVPLLISSALLYLAGMVLNDVCDYEQDCRERPQRPLPSGRIRPTQATYLAVGLLVVGLAAGWTATWLSADMSSGVMATALAACVVLYDLRGKRTPAGPLLMGACRFLNVLMGMSAAWHLTPPSLPVAGLGIAAGIGVYVMGITWFARAEARVSHRPHLLAAAAVMVAGIVLLSCYPRWSDPEGVRAVRLTQPWIWPILLLLLTLPVWRRVLSAIVQPSAVHVQAAVKQSLLTLILLDAAVCLAAVGPRAALAVLSLLVPFVVLGRWVYST